MSALPKPAPASVLPTLPPAGIAPPDPAYAPLWRQLGADSCRVSMVDLEMRSHLASRWMVEGGASGGIGLDQTLDSTIAGAATLISRLSESRGQPAGRVTSHMLSPRRWVYMWRVNDRIGVLAQVQHTIGRTAPSEFDAAAVRLVCEHWLSTELEAIGAWHAASAPWNRTERRSRAPTPRVLWAVLASLLACIAIGLWVLLSAASAAAGQAAQHQREVQRLGELTDGTLVNGLSTKLAGGDYGELQESLTQHAALQHFSSAVVSNARGLVVAQEGITPSLRIGAPVPDEVRARMRALPLTAAGQAQGQLLMMASSGAAAAAADTAAALRGVGAALCLVALTGGGLLVLHLRRRRR